MTLAKLAALAAKHDPGFERPHFDCVECLGRGWVENGDDCGECDEPGTGRIFDDSPAALLMAVMVFEAKRGAKAGVGGVLAFVTDATTPQCASAAEHDCTPEGIARAALVALLRAHGVEVPNAEP